MVQDRGRLAGVILEALDNGGTLTPPSEGDPGFDLAAATAVSAEITRLRQARGERMVGRKIGFTNRTLWEAYGVRAPIWGPVWDTTCDVLGQPVPLSGLCEPKIEPEIIFRLGRAPEADLSPEALLDCVSGVAFGFEIVRSPYPGWRFRPADTVACGALHGALRTGPFQPVTGPLGRFDAVLSCDGVEVARGASSDVMVDGPLAALAHLVEVLREEGSPPLAAGEMVSTGTLTSAMDVAPGQVWSARLEGLDLPAAEVTFV